MKNIIIIDMQNGFINQNNSHLIEKINNYLHTNKFDNVIYTKFINYETSPFVKFLDWNAMQTKEEQEFCVDVLQNNSRIIQKAGYGVKEEDINKLKELGIEEIEICGTDIDACVLSIAFQLFDNNIKPIIKKDLCASSSSNPSLYDCSIAIMTNQFGKDNIQ